jgi:hypothetical protein
LAEVLQLGVRNSADNTPVHEGSICRSSQSHLKFEDSSNFSAQRLPFCFGSGIKRRAVLVWERDAAHNSLNKHFSEFFEVPGVLVPAMA